MNFEITLTLGHLVGLLYGVVVVLGLEVAIGVSRGEKAITYAISVGVPVAVLLVIHLAVIGLLEVIGA